MGKDLPDFTDEELYDFLDRLILHRQRHGRGRNEGAAGVRDYCTKMRRKVKNELKRRGLDGTRPTDCRVYGPGQARWQGAKVKA